MKKEFDYNDVIYRLGYFRNKNNLSARETSLRLGFSDAFFNRIERGSIELKVSTLLKFFEIVNISPLEFFYPKPDSFEKDSEIIDLVLSLSPENKDVLLNLAKKLK